MKLPLLSLVIPVYNESRRITKGLDLVINYLKTQPYLWEIIVVNDGSTDNTIDLALKYKSQIHLINTALNFGKGHAVRLGVEASGGEYVIFSDVDFSVPPEFIDQFIKALKSIDIVIGSRRLRESQVGKHQNFLRESLGHGFTKLSNFILGLNHSDLTCGFKGFRRQVGQDLFYRQRLNRWVFDSEILFLAKKFDYKVNELPVIWHNDPLTKVNLLKDFLVSFISLIAIRFIH